MKRQNPDFGIEPADDDDVADAERRCRDWLEAKSNEPPGFTSVDVLALVARIRQLEKQLEFEDNIGWDKSR